MRQLNDQSRWKRWVRQDVNKSQIEDFNQSLDHAVRLLDASFYALCTLSYIDSILAQRNLQMHILRLQNDACQRTKELDDQNRGRHNEVLYTSQMTECEREVRATHL